jgi:S-adenosylmethionine:tRNA ribosyltransferase-isomerase
MNIETFDSAKFDFKVPVSLIAQEPAAQRDASRLLIINRSSGALQEGLFRDSIGFLNEGDVLVLNNTRVIRAKLLGKNKFGSKVEILLVKQREPGIWETLVRPGKRLKTGDIVSFDKGGLRAQVLERTAQGGKVLQFQPKDFISMLDAVGEPPLPHYIKKNIEDFAKYQTVYAVKEGAIAAPTAGLHFTQDFLATLKAKGVIVAFITLHCGLATFRPVKSADIRTHAMDAEWLEVPLQTVHLVNAAHARGTRVVAVGTTAIRALEAASCEEHMVTSYNGETKLYITPGYSFKTVDAVITNFHTPLSTNLILISAFCGYDLLKKAYQYAIEKKFRFYSFGDSMMVI